MRDTELPRWTVNGTSDVKSDVFRDLSQTLDMTTSSLSAALRMAGDHPGPAAVDEMLHLYGRGSDLVRTLLTICRAHQGVNAADGASVAARSRLLARKAELDAAGRRVLSIVRALPNPGEDLEADRTYETYPEILSWKRASESLGSVWEEKVSGVSYLHEVMTPLYALHTHMTSTMSIEVEATGHHPRRQSYGLSLAVLRNSDDPILRRTTFESMNAWFASHANAFADVLNAISGLRVALWKEAGLRFPEVHLKRERTSPEAYRAMLTAIDEALPDIRRSVTMRARMALSLSLSDPDPKMPVCHLMAPFPENIRTRGSTYGDHLRDLAASSAAVDPSFGAFLREAHERHWVDGRNFSLKTGSSWCDDLPSLGAVRILTHFYPNLASEVRVAHLFGVAHHLRILHAGSPAERCFPLSITEIAGKFYEALLLRHMRREAERSGIDAFRKTILWQDLSRLSNFLLTIPVRHRILAGLYKERLHGALSVRALNELSDDSWRHYFGDTTFGTDRYVWAYKPHFYRQETVAYDWQYVMGYLLGERLVDCFESDPEKAGGVTALWRASGLLSTDDIIRTRLGEDPTTVAFWRRCIQRVLWPLKVAEAVTA